MACVPVAGPWVVVPASQRHAAAAGAVAAQLPEGLHRRRRRRGADRPAIDVWFLATSGSPVGPGTTTSRTVVFVATYVGSRSRRRPSARTSAACPRPAAADGERRRRVRSVVPARPADRASRARRSRSRATRRSPSRAASTSASSPATRRAPSARRSRRRRPRREPLGAVRRSRATTSPSRRAAATGAASCRLRQSAREADELRPPLPAADAARACRSPSLVYLLRRAPADALRRHVHEPRRARVGRRRALAAPLRAARAVPARARRALRRARAAAPQHARRLRPGDGHPRRRRLGLDARDGREADPPRRGAGGRPHVPRARAEARARRPDRVLERAAGRRSADARTATLLRQSLDELDFFQGYGGTAIGDALAAAVELGKQAVPANGRQTIAYTVDEDEQPPLDPLPLRRQADARRAAAAPGRAAREGGGHPRVHGRARDAARRARRARPAAASAAAAGRCRSAASRAAGPGDAERDRAARPAASSSTRGRRTRCSRPTRSSARSSAACPGTRK